MDEVGPVEPHSRAGLDWPEPVIASRASSAVGIPMQHDKMYNGFAARRGSYDWVLDSIPVNPMQNPDEGLPDTAYE